MSELATINVHRRGGAATIELSRPESMNAWNKQFGLDLRAAVEQVAEDDTVRAVCITGAGRGFSSGADLKDLSGEELSEQGRPDVQKALTERYHPIITGVRTMPKPVIAAVNGPAVGIGLSLALAADLVVAKQSAYFLLAFVNIGLVPDGGSSLFVPERVGFTRAAEMAMLGERIGAEQAAEWGLINRAIPDDVFDAEVEALVDRLAAGATAAHAGIKRQLNAWLFPRMDAQLELEAQLQQDMAHSDDFVEGVSAFLQKRRARFAGR
jgi:2-(1,2-epoxy-1,2-dihydrophenyl)acetyl-CoA isomerase